MKRVIATLLVAALVLVVAGAVIVVSNMNWISARAASSVLSSLLGGADVKVHKVTLRGGRQVLLEGVTVNESFRIRSASITYDLADFLARRVHPESSVIRVDIDGLEAKLEHLKSLVDRSGGSRGRSGTATAETSPSRKNIPSTWRAPVGLSDCRIDLGDAGVFIVHKAEINYEAGDGKPQLALRAVQAELGSAQAQGDVILDLPLKVAMPAEADIQFTGVGVGDVAVNGELRVAQGKPDEFDFDVRGDEGHAVVGFKGNISLAMTEGKPEVAARGELAAHSVKWAQLDLRNWTVNVDAVGGQDGASIRVKGSPTSVDRIAQAIGLSVPVDGWLEWNASANLSRDRADLRAEIVDGKLTFDGIEGALTDVSGFITGDMLQASLTGSYGGGRLQVDRIADNWQIKAEKVRVTHQLVRAMVDGSAVFSASPVARLEGQLTVSDGTLDAVTAGFSSAKQIPDVALDLTVIAGNGLKVVRDASWADVASGSRIHVAGSVRKPHVEGTVQLNAGELSMANQSLTVVEGSAAFTGDGAEPKFALTVRDRIAGDDIDVTAFGTLGSIRLQLAEALEDATLPRQGDALMKLIGERVRLYILDSVARWMQTVSGGSGRI